MIIAEADVFEWYARFMPTKAAPAPMSGEIHNILAKRLVSMRAVAAGMTSSAEMSSVPMTRIVQRAIRRLREEAQANPSAFDRLLHETLGMRKAGDGLAIQRELRAEWDKRK